MWTTTYVISNIPPLASQAFLLALVRTMQKHEKYWFHRLPSTPLMFLPPYQWALSSTTQKWLRRTKPLNEHLLRNGLSFNSGEEHTNSSHNCIEIFIRTLRDKNKIWWTLQANGLCSKNMVPYGNHIFRARHHVVQIDAEWHNAMRVSILQKLFRYCNHCSQIGAKNSVLYIHRKSRDEGSGHELERQGAAEISGFILKRIQTF